MRLVTFQRGDDTPRLGIVQGDRVTDVSELTPEGRGDMFTSVLELIEDEGLDVLERAARDGLPGDLALDEVRLWAPIPRPGANVICLGRNYQEHAEEMARARSQEVMQPTFFSKAVTSIIGPYDDIPFDPDLSTQLDWEVELAVVIGREAKRVSREDALDHVFGYTVLNDVSARDLQYSYGGQFFYGKSLDGTCPIGPWIVTRDEIPDPQNLPLRLRVNGVTKQEANTRDMIFDVAETIARLSRGMTLEPGQILATGTPAGVGNGRNPKEFLQPGDVMESEIEGIGTMRNRVKDVSGSHRG